MQTARVSTTPRRLRHLLLVAMGQEEVGRCIRTAREDAHLTQPELAALIGLKHPQSVSNYERGITDVPPRRLRKIAEETGKPISFFLGEQPPASRPEGDEGKVLAALENMQATLERLVDSVERLSVRAARPGARSR